MKIRIFIIVLSSVYLIDESAAGYMPDCEPSKGYLDVTREKMRSVLYAAVQGVSMGERQEGGQKLSSNFFVRAEFDGVFLGASA